MLLQLWTSKIVIPILHRKCRYLISWALGESKIFHRKESLAKTITVYNKMVVAAIKTIKKR